ncbi:hypothetical protein GCM10010466_65520 [Planomonospora alba]|uniref:Uncharacterized protein n=1 Tax=Planomonospora alba TaxID=161354 RepID=A0ABP6P2W4_9ACTN
MERLSASERNDEEMTVGTHTKTKTESRPVDWSLTPRGPVSATAQGVLALAALATVGDAVELAPLWGGAATAAGAVGTVLAGAHRQLAPSALLYRLACWIGAGSWWTWTLIDTPWSQSAWAALGIGALTAGVTAPLGRTRAARPVAGAPAATGTALVPRRYATLAAEWAARIKRCCTGLTVTIEDVREWPTRTGYSLLVVLPPGGATLSRLENAAEGMANDARLPLGCGVEFTPGNLRGTLWMHVATVNRLADDIDPPADYAPQSVLDGITLGEHRDGSPMRIQVRQPRTIVVGTTGSGKTGTLHAITRELGLCYDNLTWHMDLNGGGVSQPWLRAWLDGQADRPPVDWAAPCPEEALLMATALVAIAKERKTAYSARRVEADEDLLPVDADVPQITTVLDEGFEVLSPQVRDPLQKRIRERIEESARIGRAEACQVLVSALRSTANTLSTDLLALLHNRIIMAGCQEQELLYLYGQSKGVSVEDLSGPGSGFVRTFGSHEVRTWKAWRMKPKRDVHPASRVISRIRPDLDAPSVAAAGRAYRTRYERMRWLFSTPEQRCHLPRPQVIELPGITDDRGNPIAWDPALTHPAAGQEVGTAPATTPAPRPATSPVGPRRLTVLPGGADASAWADPIDLARGPRPARSTADASAWADPVPAGRLRAEQVHPVQAPSVPAASTAEHPVPQIVIRALEVFDELRAERLHSRELAAALDLTEGDLAALLRPLGVDRPANAFLRGGQRGRGYERSSLEMAAERIRCGQIDVPAEVAAWPAA